MKVETDQESCSNSSTSKLSSDYLKEQIELLKMGRLRPSTAKNYHTVWRLFNKFILRLDNIPDMWEDHTALFCAYMTKCGIQSATLKSYISAIKGVLINDNYKWNDNLVLLGSLTIACRLQNDVFRTRLPIHFKLLELILFEINRQYQDQNYLSVMYKTIFAIGYYGLFRVGELVKTNTANHTMKAKNIHVAQNKMKILILLYSSKTLTEGGVPHKIKITGTDNLMAPAALKFFCPFLLIRQFIEFRGGYLTDEEQFFVFKDGTPIHHGHVRSTLRSMIKKLGLNPLVYNTHSLRTGRSVDMLRCSASIDEIKRAGRWKSSAVFRYLKS